MTTVMAVRDPALSGVAGAATLAALHVRDPHESGSWGFCPFLMITGHPCPGCGGLRAVNDLTNGDIVGAVSSNAFAVAVLAVLAVTWTMWTVRRLRGDVQARWLSLGATQLTVVLVVMVAFGAFRLTPWGAWLRP